MVLPKAIRCIYYHNNTELKVYLKTYKMCWKSFFFWQSRGSIPTWILLIGLLEAKIHNTFLEFTAKNYHNTQEGEGTTHHKATRSWIAPLKKTEACRLSPKQCHLRSSYTLVISIPRLTVKLKVEIRQMTAMTCTVYEAYPGSKTTSRQCHLRGGNLKGGRSTRRQRWDPREGIMVSRPGIWWDYAIKKHGRRRGIKTHRRHWPATGLCNHQRGMSTKDQSRALSVDAGKNSSMTTPTGYS